MIYRGTLHTTDGLPFIRAMLAGVDELGGCFVPTDITPLPAPFFKNIAEMSAKDVAYVVANAMIGNDYTAEELRRLVDEWIVDDMVLSRAGNGIYALEPWAGTTMSQYDMVGRLQAILLRNCYDRMEVSLDSVFFSPSMGDSCAAISQAFKYVIGKSPVMLQSAGSLSDIEKRQMNDVVDSEMLYIVACDQQSLWRLCCRIVNNASVFAGRKPVLVGDANVASLMARVYCFFESFRLLAVNEVDGAVCICPDRCNAGDMLAAHVAVDMGLPVDIVESTSVENEDDVIMDAYSQCGYILNPRAAERWKALYNHVAEKEVSGVFINPSHPAKFRSRLEPLLNRVIMLPNKLHFKDVSNVRHKTVAPSVNALKNCFTNY